MSTDPPSQNSTVDAINRANSIVDAINRGETVYTPNANGKSGSPEQNVSSPSDDEAALTEDMLEGPPQETKASKGRGKKERKRLDKNDPLAFVPSSNLFVTPKGETYAKILCGNHFENWPINSRQFKRWLTHQIRKRLGVIANSQALQEIVQQFDAIAYEDGIRQEFCLRIGRWNGSLYIDMADDLWRVIEITAGGWKIISGDALFFRRSDSSGRLCEPEEGYTVNELRSLVNFESEDDFVLFVGAIVAALRDDGPFPVTFIHGEEGSGKTYVSGIFSDLINPSIPRIQTTPKDLRDLIISAQNSHAMVIDNASFIDGFFSDLICSLSTGVGYRTRFLHTNSEEFIFEGARAIAFNGITSLIERSDLMSRAIIVRLAHISDEKRLTGRKLDAQWKIAWPRVLGALCDAVSSALRNIDRVTLDRPSRMADVEEWLIASEQGLGWEAGTFSEALRRKQKDSGDTAFEADLVAVAIKDWLDRENLTYWLGTMTSLLGVLDGMVSEKTRELRAWPKTNQGLGNAIARSQRVLRLKGIIVNKQHSGERKVTITRAQGA